MTATITPSPVVRTFQPTQQIVGRELRGDRVAVRLACGHVADVVAAAAVVSLRCAACRPVEVLRG